MANFTTRETKQDGGEKATRRNELSQKKERESGKRKMKRTMGEL